jgi:hypothetical protein
LRCAIGWQLRFFASLLVPYFSLVELARKALLLTVKKLKKFNRQIAHHDSCPLSGASA